MDSQYVDIVTDDGDLLRVWFEVTVGDLLIAAALSLLFLFLIVSAVLKILWR